MSLSGSETRWLRELDQGNEEAARKLYERYFRRLERVFSQKLGPLRVLIDGEDIAQSALATFFQGNQDRRFPDLHHRDNLWRLLWAIADIKLKKRREAAFREKRDLRRQVGEAALDKDGDSAARGLDQFDGDLPTPEFAAILSEEYDRLMGLLDNDEMREVARLRLENFKNTEIADQLGRSARTIERSLSQIRVRWSLEIETHE